MISALNSASMLASSTEPAADTTFSNVRDKVKEDGKVEAQEANEEDIAD
jgi:hypothetical protein